MSNKKEIEKELKAFIGEGVHTSLRKFVDSRQSSVAWQAIRDLPDGEWATVCGVVAYHLLEIYDIKRKEK